MGEYNDVIIEIKGSVKDKFDRYLSNEDSVLVYTSDVKYNPVADTYIYQWTGDHQLYIRARIATYFTLADEMECTGLGIDDYFAEMLTENDVYEKCGSLSPSYLREMKALVWDDKEACYK